MFLLNVSAKYSENMCYLFRISSLALKYQLKHDENISSWLRLSTHSTQLMFEKANGFCLMLKTTHMI